MSRIVPQHLCGGVPSTACYACGYARGQLDAEAEHCERVRAASQADTERQKAYFAAIEGEMRRKWVEMGEGHARLALEALARRCGELQASADRLRQHLEWVWRNLERAAAHSNDASARRIAVQVRDFARLASAEGRRGGQ